MNQSPVKETEEQELAPEMGQLEDPEPPAQVSENKPASPVIK